MSWFESVRALLPPLDRRTAGEIDRDLEDEFGFHLEQLERELVEAGHDAETACAAALCRFGNVGQIKSRCKRIALEERIMLQRINAVLMVVVLIAVGFVSVQVYLTQRSPQASVLVEGAVGKPGWYPITLDGATYLRDVLQQAGVAPEQFLRHFQAGRTTRAMVLVHQGREYLGEEPKKVILHPNDEIRVFDEFPEAYLVRPVLAGYSLDGTWKQVDVDAGVVDKGWRLEIETPPAPNRFSFSNSDMIPRGSLRRAGSQQSIGLRFCDKRQLIVSEPLPDGRTLGIGQWSYEFLGLPDLGRLVIDVSPVLAEYADPIVLMREEQRALDSSDQ